MSYTHIDNLYRNQLILMQKECYAMEKIHGTSSHISYKAGRVGFFSGGGPYEVFVQLFDQDNLKAKLAAMLLQETSLQIYGEFYGGPIQKMSETYGPSRRFVAFEVKIGNCWLNVPKAEQIVRDLGIDFVHYVRIPCTLETIDEQRDAPSVQAVKNGITEPKLREGIVLRPLEELTTNNGERVIAKHKRDEFRETATPRNVTDKLIKRTEIKAIVDEWVTEERLGHILSDGEISLDIKNTGNVIKKMIEDIYREGRGELEESKELEKVIGRETALMFKRRLNSQLKEDNHE